MEEETQEQNQVEEYEEEPQDILEEAGKDFESKMDQLREDFKDILG